jgi:hypothetical protein
LPRGSLSAHTETIWSLMNKKILGLVVASLALASAASAASSNIVGYVKVNLKPGLNLVANPLNNTNPNGNKISSLFAGKTASVLRWTGTQFSSTDLFEGTIVGGTDADILPGEAIFVDIGENTDVTWVGEALVGTQTVAVGAGNSFVASKIPLAGTATSLGLAPADSISALTWDNATSSFKSYDYFPGAGWIGSLGEPSFAVAQGFLIQSGAAFSWVKTFTPAP